MPVRGRIRQYAGIKITRPQLSYKLVHEILIDSTKIGSKTEFMLHFIFVILNFFILFLKAEQKTTNNLF